jgi:pSer/pThr/pTyr-binding forkhead associated (FHA) protein
MLNRSQNLAKPSSFRHARKSLTAAAAHRSFQSTMAVRFVVRSRDGQKLQAELDFPFDQTRIVLGRGAAADVRIPHPAVSEAHASVQLRGAEWMLTDLGSRNGTKHNGQRLLSERARKLRDGDLVELGTYVLSFHSGVLMTEPMSAERTAELARRLWREAQSARGIDLPAPRLTVLNGVKQGDTLEIPPAPSRMHIGSHKDCQLVLPEPALGRDTLEVAHDMEGVLIRSLAGEALIQLGGHAFKSRRLRDGDELQVGETRLSFEEPAQSAIDALKAEPDLPLPISTPGIERTETTPGPYGDAQRRRDSERAPSKQPSGRSAASSGAPSSSAPREPLGGSERARSATPAGSERIRKGSGEHERKPERSDADLVIYALAIAVLVASALGLVLLLRVR